MLLGNDLDNFHNFFHQLLVLWINHVVLLLMSQLVHIFSSTMLSFVSISSMTVFVFPQVRQSQSGCCRCFASRTQAPLAYHWLQNCTSSVKHIHHCLLLHYAVSGSNRSIIDSFQIFQTCNRPTIDLLPDSHDRPTVDSFPDFTNSFSNSFDLSSGFVRLENHTESGYLTPCDLTP